MSIRRRIACVVAVSLLAGAAIAGQRGQPAAPTLVIDHPGPTTALTGREALRAHVEPAATKVATIDFIVDGKLICHVVQPPFQCIFDAGLRPQAYSVQVIAVLADKRQLTREVRAEPPPSARERSEGRIVRVPLFVSDGRGRNVDPVAAESVEVLEDTVTQPLVGLLSTEIPLDVAVAVDISASMERVLPTVKVALNEFLSSFRDADSVRLFTFSDRLSEVTRTRSWSAALDDIVPRGTTALNDGIIESIERMNTHPARRAIVVFADAEEKHSRASLTTVRERVLDQDAAVYLVFLAPDRSSRTTRETFDDLGAATGGRTIRATPAQLRRVLQDIRTQLNQYYLVTYNAPRPNADGREHTIQVRLRDRRDVRLQARTRYLDVQ